jgi:hypothetical protein
MADLLSEYEQRSWGSALRRLAQEYADDPTGIARRVLTFFGGMGSLNDLVLYRNGNVAPGASETLDGLRREVYDACRNLLGSSTG